MLAFTAKCKFRVIFLKPKVIYLVLLYGFIMHASLKTRDQVIFCAPGHIFVHRMILFSSYLVNWKFSFSWKRFNLLFQSKLEIVAPLEIFLMCVF